ncbi:HIT family protein [Actinospica robiniae]|uniref:HIT family protein n=1 Tax=Actinospica robiniae TaxID=304901 RepID=UPI0003F7F18F|nr:HIT domain-containing protein [Actinospica robiniae]
MDQRTYTLPGKVLVAPKRHVEHVIRDLSETEYLRLMRFVRRVARAVEAAFPMTSNSFTRS